MNAILTKMDNDRTRLAELGELHGKESIGYILEKRMMVVTTQLAVMHERYEVSKNLFERCWYFNAVQCLESEYRFLQQAQTVLENRL